jgi:TIR domain
MAEIFISYKTEDRRRIAPLVAALRGAGLDVWWDQDIPPGGGWRETIETELNGATLCVVAWSKESVGTSGRFVREEAERAAVRGAYLGVLIDDVMPPFGFSEWQSIRMAEWNGKPSDPMLGDFVEQVRARLENRPAERKVLAKRRSWTLPLAIGGGLALLGAVALGVHYYPAAAPAPPPATPTAFVNARLDQAACAWLQISSVTPAADGERVALTGIAASPQAVQESLMGAAMAAHVPLAELAVDDVAAGPQQTCAQLQFMRNYAWQGRARLHVREPRGAFQHSAEGLSIAFEFDLDYRDLPEHAALLGLDSIGGVEVLVEDLHEQRRHYPPYRLNGEVATYQSIMDDEGQGARNVGLVLMTSTESIHKGLVERIGRSGDRSTLARLTRAAAEGHWQFELALVRCGFENGASGSHPC